MYQKYIQTNGGEKNKKHRENKLRKKRFGVNSFLFFSFWFISKRRRDNIWPTIDSYMFRKLQKLTEKLKKSLEKTEFSFYIASL